MPKGVGNGKISQKCPGRTSEGIAGEIPEEVCDDFL